MLAHSDPQQGHEGLALKTLCLARLQASSLLQRLPTSNFKALCLQGSIPAALSTLNNAASINLSANELSGALPSDLAALSPAATLDLSNNPRLCGGVPRSLLDGLMVRTEGTGLNLPCFERWVGLRISGTDPVPVGPGLQLITTAAPNPALLEDFDTSKVTLTLSEAPRAGTLSLQGGQLGQGSQFGWRELNGGAVSYAPAVAAPLPAGFTDSFVLGVSYEGRPVSDMSFTITGAKGKALSWNYQFMLLLREGLSRLLSLAFLGGDVSGHLCIKASESMEHGPVLMGGIRKQRRHQHLQELLSLLGLQNTGMHPCPSRHLCNSSCAADDGGFPSDAKVVMQTLSGPRVVEMSRVSVGDKVKAVCGDGTLCFDEVYLVPFQQVGPARWREWDSVSIPLLQPLLKHI